MTQRGAAVDAACTRKIQARTAQVASKLGNSLSRALRGQGRTGELRTGSGDSRGQVKGGGHEGSGDEATVGMRSGGSVNTTGASQTTWPTAQV